ncbi:MAG: DUF928 domain-containing protein [Cyanobacteria bacterium P01_F01_bin.86]
MEAPFFNTRKSMFRRFAGVLLGSSLLFGTLPAFGQAAFRLNLPDLRAPGNRESGATRSTTCIASNENLVALIPDSNYGLTESGYPTFYFYLPPTDAPLVKFVVYNETTNELFYEGQFRIKGESGVLGVTLPNNGLQKSLEVGQSYVWYLSVVCDPDAIDQSANPVVEAMVERVDPLPEVAQSAATDLPRVYAEAGIWYDALAASANLRQQDDGAAWNTLLNAVDLEGLILTPLLSEEASSEAQTVSVTH